MTVTMENIHIRVEVEPSRVLALGLVKEFNTSHDFLKSSYKEAPLAHGLHIPVGGFGITYQLALQSD